MAPVFKPDTCFVVDRVDASGTDRVAFVDDLICNMLHTVLQNNNLESKTARAW